MFSGHKEVLLENRMKKKYHKFTNFQRLQIRLFLLQELRMLTLRRNLKWVIFEVVSSFYITQDRPMKINHSQVNPYLIK